MAANPFSGETYLRAVLDGLPTPVLVVDGDMIIHDANRAARVLIGECADKGLLKLCGESLHCLNAEEAVGGCGTSADCCNCVIRQAGEAACAGRSVFRKTAKLVQRRNGTKETIWLLVTGAPLATVGEGLALMSLEDVTELVALRQLIPMCAHCRKVRDDDDFWHYVEEYLVEQTSIQFTHGLCPDCVRELYPDIADEVNRLTAEERQRA